ncbi:SixA phosphatase family protein [Pseudoalteromonas sp. S16_S37]|uniref:SixA phosphatase family protein n=1 Tax=Pseudoalteromonas sp. S16_S37 TaxID=2720228 RepID=UPI0016819861|nr:histidine phosphatase family protein [Pseudoalteromonas sp. S16_S37]MBD1582844.1 histidine phosphatase family protein [Pseudoalteromonas sp. S16_S37]
MKIKNLFLPLLLLSNAALALPEHIILFRHAEKAKGPNPELLEAGQQRAHHLATLFSELPISHLFSTDYKRTQQTIAPLANTHNLSVQSYDPSNLKAFAEQLIKLEGNIVVAGHSNTTPELVNLLSAKQVSIAEDEFNKVFVVSFADKNKAHVLTLSSDIKSK